MLGSSRVAAELAASQEKLSSMSEYITRLNVVTSQTIKFFVNTVFLLNVILYSPENVDSIFLINTG
jgi:hypothetical protein